MAFEDISEADITSIRRELAEQVLERGMHIDGIQVSYCADTGLLDLRGVALTDPFLQSSGTWQHRRIRFRVQAFCRSDESESEVLLGHIEYAVDREHSNFHPVPDDYGSEVTIAFNWEFDRTTLEYGAASVQDRDRLHFVSVLPNNDFVAFIECCSVVVEKWA